MPSSVRSSSVRSAADLELGVAVTAALRDLLPAVAEQTVAAVIAEVPAYAGALSGEMRGSISRAVEMALLGFLKLASQPWQSDPATPLGPALDAAHALGRGEARSGRSVDALLAAYRVGARVAWRAMAEAATRAGMAVTTMARFADLVFAYIDELSAASVAGHTDELSTSGRVRERYLEQLAQQLLAGATTDVLVASAERADWPVPGTLTAVLLPDTQPVHGLTSFLPAETLRPREELPGLEDLHETALLLVPDVAGADREQLLQALAGRQAVIGPARPWTQVGASYLRAVRTLRLEVEAGDGAVDTERYLADLVLGADPDALADLRAQVLAPLSGLRPGTAERLAQTLRSWLLHQGRRDDVAADLFVHAQTVRYRMGQLRELYGDRLQDPNTVLQLTIALGATEETGPGLRTAGAFRRAR
jgi:PucR C-terminal helix-turn-helix domain